MRTRALTRQAAIVGVLQRDWVLCCPHLVGEQVPFMICAVHPGAGVMCEECMKRHDTRAQHRPSCDQCGRSGIPLVHVEQKPFQVSELGLLQTSGARTVFAGPIWPFLLEAYCPPCVTRWLDEHPPAA